MADDFDISGLLDQAESLPSGKEPVAPEDEVFHCLYIAGQNRVNESGVTEEANKLQIRGTKLNNLLSCYGIILHVKSVLVCNETVAGKESLKCFSYQSGSLPYKGSSGNVCPKNSRMRAAVPFCKDCRNQLIVSLILVDENGAPVKDEKGELVKIFIRGKGTKYPDVSDYLNELYGENFQPPILSPDKVKQEKSVINNKRVITKIEIGERDSKFGVKKVFKLIRGKALSIDTVKKILEVSTSLVKEFNKKFDWSQITEQDSQEEQAPETSAQESTSGMPWDGEGENPEGGEEAGPEDVAGDFF